MIQIEPPYTKTKDGIELSVYKHSIIFSPNSGTVSEVTKNHVLIIELGKYRCLFTNIKPSVRLKQHIGPGDQIGIALGNVGYTVNNDSINALTYLDGDRYEYF